MYLVFVALSLKFIKLVFAESLVLLQEIDGSQTRTWFDTLERFNGDGKLVRGSVHGAICCRRVLVGATFL